MENLIDKLKQEDKERIISLIVQRRNFAKFYRDQRKDEWNLMWQYYCCYKRKEKYKSNIFIPLFYEFVETITPMIYKSLTAIRPYITIIPTEVNDVQASINMEKLIDLQLSQPEVNFKEKLFCAIKDTLIFGTHFLKILPTYKKDLLIPIIDNVDIFDSYFHPRAKTAQDAYYAILEYIKPLTYLIENYRLTKKDVERIKETTNTKYLKTDRWSLIDIDTRDYTMYEPVLHEYYGYLKVNEEDKEEPYIATIINDSILARLEKNPFDTNEIKNFKPIIHLKDIPISNQFYGFGMLKSIISLQEEINTRRNQRSDNINRTINNMWKVLKGGGIDISQLVSRPDGIIAVNDMNAVQPHIIPDVTQNVVAEIQMARQDAVQATRIFPYLQGQAPVRQETAAGIITLQQAAGLGFSVVIDLFNSMGMTKIGEILGFYNQKYFNKATIREILNPHSYKFITISREDIIPKSSFDYMATGSAEEGIENSQIRRLNYLKLFNMILALPPEIEDLLPTGERIKYRINHFQAIKRLFEVFDEKLATKILVREQEIPQLSEEELRQILMAAKPAEATLEAELTPTEEEFREGVAPPVTGVVPKKNLRPEKTDVESLAKSLAARITL